MVQPINIKYAIVQPINTKYTMVQPTNTKYAMVQPTNTKYAMVQPKKPTYFDVYFWIKKSKVNYSDKQLFSFVYTSIHVDLEREEVCQ